jgi:hypothetical protein
MRLYIGRVKQMWWLMLYPGNLRRMDPYFPYLYIFQVGLKTHHREWLENENIIKHMQKLEEDPNPPKGYTW